MKNISICIPTFNRSALLQECLEHLLGFADTSFEVVVGDNASADNTQEVVARLRGKFASFTYLRHQENIGFARNMDAILRRASRDFVYIVSDDDLLFETALQVGASVLASGPQFVGVVGRYLSLRTLNTALRVDFSDAVATLVPKGAFATLADNLTICDGHPIMRREMFQQNCFYADRTGTLVPLYFSLLQHGDIAVIDKPFFQHRTTGESLSGRMSDAWFLDMFNADIELATTLAQGQISQEALAGIRQRLLRLLYLQAVRMAFNRGKHYEMWLFLRRLMAVEGAALPMLVKCEHRFAHDFLLDRIATMLGDAAFTTLAVVDSPLTRTVCAALLARGCTVHMVHATQGAVLDRASTLLCCNRQEQLAFGQGAHALVLEHLFAQLRLTQLACSLQVLGDRITVAYATAEGADLLGAASPGYDVVCAPYSEGV